MKRESSLRFQVGAAFVLFIFCLIQRPPVMWCALFAACAAVVISLELINAAIEAVLDKMHPGFDKEIGFAKDCLAGAVLIASLVSVLIFSLYLLSIV